MKIIHVVGIDEVGRGPLAGPVTVCACSVPRTFDQSCFKGIRDSKKLSPKKREEWFMKISALKTAGKLDFVFKNVSAKEIDKNGISAAIRKAVKMSLDALRLSSKSTYVMLDGALYAPAKFVFQETVIKGDEKIPIISAASIIAKVMRDALMVNIAKTYPEYGFEKHKGYGTAQHIKAIQKQGVTDIHRRSFLKNII